MSQIDEPTGVGSDGGDRPPPVVHDQYGRTVEELSSDRPLLLVFLRQFG